MLTAGEKLVERTDAPPAQASVRQNIRLTATFCVEGTRTRLNSNAFSYGSRGETQRLKSSQANTMFQSHFGWRAGHASGAGEDSGPSGTIVNSMPSRFVPDSNTIGTRRMERPWYVAL